MEIKDIMDGGGPEKGDERTSLSQMVSAEEREDALYRLAKQAQVHGDAIAENDRGIAAIHDKLDRILAILEAR